MITYQFRIYPNKKQKGLIDKQLEVHRELYNKCLDVKIKSYEDIGKSPSCFDLIKSEIPQYKGFSNYSSLQQTVRRLEKSFNSFFKQNAKFPRFKSENRFRTINYGKYGDGCKLKNGKLYLQYVGNIKIKLHRHPTEIKTLGVTKKNGEYFVNVSCENEIPNNKFDNKSSCVGIDFGIQTSIITSDDEFISSPYFSKHKHKELKKLYRKKKYKAIQKVHKKISNQRKDFNHKLANYIVKKWDIICLEDLSVRGIQSENKKPVNRKLYDIGINQLINFMKYKAENAGKKLVMVNPAYTTQTCSKCGNIQKLELSQREYVCGNSSCGYVDNRDCNAAKNIKRLGLESLGFGPRSLGIYSGE
jgi:putative transposase